MFYSYGYTIVLNRPLLEYDSKMVLYFHLAKTWTRDVCSYLPFSIHILLPLLSWMSIWVKRIRDYCLEHGNDYSTQYKGFLDTEHRIFFSLCQRFCQNQVLMIIQTKDNVLHLCKTVVFWVHSSFEGGPPSDSLKYTEKKKPGSWEVECLVQSHHCLPFVLLIFTREQSGYIHVDYPYDPVE